MRDFQKQKVYDWENSIITVPTRQIAFSQAQTLVDGLWLAEGLLYPPKVVPKPKQKTTAWAAGDRSTIELPETIPEWVLLHELAHALSMHSSGHGDGHGPIFLGNYIRLLETYLRIPRLYLIASATALGLQFKLDAQPIFKDK